MSRTSPLLHRTPTQELTPVRSLLRRLLFGLPSDQRQVPRMSEQLQRSSTQHCCAIPETSTNALTPYLEFGKYSDLDDYCYHRPLARRCRTARGDFLEVFQCHAHGDLA